MTQSQSIMIVAGEASADLHGEELVAALVDQNPDVQLWGAGGASMRRHNFDAVVPAEAISIAGLTEVLFSLPRLWSLMRRLARLAKERKPAVAVLIDLPDFNLRLAKKLRKLDIPVVYYISPQVWAWRSGRVKQIKNLVNQMLCILPFEQTYYQQHGVRAQFVGHPLVEELPASPDRAAARTELGLGLHDGPLIALLPGSRPKEVSRHLPIMLEGVRLVKRRYPEAVAVIPVASTIRRMAIDKIVSRSRLPVHVVDGQSTTVLAACDAAVVCSGTATLQTALLQRPMVVVYRASWLTYHIIKRLVKVSHIALVNLIVGRKLVTELIQKALTPASIAREVRVFLDDPAERVRMTQAFVELRQKLGRGGTAKRVASIVTNYLPHKQSSSALPGEMNTVVASHGETPTP